MYLLQPFFNIIYRVWFILREHFAITQREDFPVFLRLVVYISTAMATIAMISIITKGTLKFIDYYTREKTATVSRRIARQRVPTTPSRKR